MSSEIFYGEFGSEPFGYVGQESTGDNSFVVYNSLHSLKSKTSSITPVAPISLGSIHRVTSTLIQLRQVIPSIGLNAIHRVRATSPVPELIFKVHNSIHKVHYLDKWNALFSYDCSRYLDTPYRFRLAETPGCDKCVDPSILEGDSGDGATILPIGTSHNDLAGLQGGVFGEYYHLTLAERNKLATMKQGSTTFVSRFAPAAYNPGDGWVNPDTQVLEMYYNTKFNGVSVGHSSEADEVDGGHF